MYIISLYSPQDLCSSAPRYDVGGWLAFCLPRWQVCHSSDWQCSKSKFWIPKFLRRPIEVLTVDFQRPCSCVASPRALQSFMCRQAPWALKLWGVCLRYCSKLLTTPHWHTAFPASDYHKSDSSATHVDDIRINPINADKNMLGIVEICFTCCYKSQSLKARQKSII